MTDPRYSHYKVRLKTFEVDWIEYSVYSANMLRSVAILLIVQLAVADVDGGQCKLSDKKLKMVSKSFEKKCLKKGRI